MTMTKQEPNGIGYTYYCPDDLTLTMKEEYYVHVKYLRIIRTNSYQKN